MEYIYIVNSIFRTGKESSSMNLYRLIDILGVIVIVEGNEHGDSSSNPGRD